MEIVKKLIRDYIYMVSIFFIGRLSLFVIYFDRFKDSDINYWLTFLHGLRMDTIVCCILLAVPTLILTISPGMFKKGMNTFLRYYFLIVLSVIIYMQQATLPFFAEYDVRPNYLFVAYLEYPKEVFSMIIADYKFNIIVATVMLSSFIYLFLKTTKETFIKPLETNYLKKIILVVPLSLILFIGARSSFGHRPANNSDAMYSSNRLINEITKNSIYSVAYAVYAQKKYGNKVKRYGKMDIKEAFSRVEKMLNIKSNSEISPFARIEKTHFKTENSKNLVIFLQESLGAQFVETVGGDKGITPNMNRLSHEGILFKNLFSNGTRSVRGIAGVVSGNFSIPGKGVVKRNKSQKDYFTLSSLLEPYGYHTMFLYGGESRFDNMRGWFLGNGFDEIIDQPMFKNPVFTGTWGVSDEDLVNRANREFKALYAKNQKFAAVLFSTSNHTPFDFPEGKIKLIDGVARKSVKNAVKYADFAIGKFIENAKKEDYYEDTVFVIIADHNVRTYGDDMVPVNMFHIPAVILGGGVKPKICDKLSTQPDVLATALDLIGLDLEYPIMGHSVFSDKKENISLMQFYTSYALRVKNKVAVIRPDKDPLTFIYKTNQLEETTSDRELEKDALAFIVTLDYLYDHKLYTIPQERKTKIVTVKREQAPDNNFIF